MEVDGTTSVCDAFLENGVEIEHACGKVRVCTTCHVIITQRFRLFECAWGKEEGMLNMAWGLQANSRLSCQTILGAKDLIAEIPKYSINQAKENA